jgi:hypothetical protein
MNENSYRTAKTVLITATVTIASVFAFSFMSKQNAKDNEFFCNGASVSIKEGDTLYWIARTNCEGNTMNVVDELVRVYGTDLTVGDTIYLPTHPNCELRMTDGGQVMEECK